MMFVRIAGIFGCAMIRSGDVWLTMILVLAFNFGKWGGIEMSRLFWFWLGWVCCGVFLSIFYILSGAIKP
jgi:hypothetical protein